MHQLLALLEEHQPSFPLPSLEHLLLELGQEQQHLQLWQAMPREMLMHRLRKPMQLSLGLKQQLDQPLLWPIVELQVTLEAQLEFIASSKVVTE